jgi:hypothetical protein
LMKTGISAAWNASPSSILHSIHTISSCLFFLVFLAPFQLSKFPSLLSFCLIFFLPSFYLCNFLFFRSLIHSIVFRCLICFSSIFFISFISSFRISHSLFLSFLEVYSCSMMKMEPEDTLRKLSQLGPIMTQLNIFSIFALCCLKVNLTYSFIHTQISQVIFPLAFSAP